MLAGMTRDGDAIELLVIGGGPAGVTAAARAAELGARVTLVERDRLGGTCTDDGCAPTRVLARAARLMRHASLLDGFGIRVGPPHLDFPALMARVEATVAELHAKKRLGDHLARQGVTVIERAGPARFVEPHLVTLADGRQLRAERMLLAGGGHARRLSLPGGELALTHNEVWAMRKLPRRLVVVGAAATGTQLASVFADFGSQVTLVEVAPRILPGEEVAIAEAIGAAFTRSGIRVLAGQGGVDAIERRGDALVAHHRAGEIEADAVLMAVGWPGNVEGLGLETAGVEAAHGYVTVDETLRTSAPHIWAAGDITGRMMLVQSATYEGRVAAENAVSDSRNEGGNQRGLRHSIVAHGGFTDPEYGSVGLSAERAAAAGIATSVGSIAYADLDRALIDRRTDGFCTVVVDRATRRMVGAHVVGEQAVEVVQIAAAATAAEMPVERLAEVEFAYPTYTSVLALAARQVVHELRLPLDEVDAWQAAGRSRVAEWERSTPS